MKKFISLLLALVMALSMVPMASAAEVEKDSAEILYELGLFKGTGTNADGTPIFDLQKTPTRNQAIIMLVRLLGKEEEALAGDWDIPFTDVVKGSTSYYYIGYAYANGLTNGTGDGTTYSGTSPVRANQYITFVLRSLGYTSGEDFKVSTAWEFSDEIGLTHGEYDATNAASFIRGDVADISANALGEEMKSGEKTLAEKLVEDEVFTKEKYEETVEDKPALAPKPPKDETANLAFKAISKEAYYWGCWGTVPSFATVKSIEYAVDGDDVYFRVKYKGDTVQKFFTMPVIWEGGIGTGTLGPMEIHSVKRGSSEFICKVPKSTFETYTEFLISPSEDGKTGPGDYIIKVGYLGLTENNKAPVFKPYDEFIDDSYEVPNFKFHSLERARVVGGYLYRVNFTNSMDRDVQFWTVRKNQNEGWNRGVMHRVVLKDGDTSAIYFVPDYVDSAYDMTLVRVRDDPKTGAFQEHAYIDIYFHGAPQMNDPME